MDDVRSSKPATRKVEKRPGDWYCYECGDLNYASREMCFKGCHVMRPAALGRAMGARRGGWESSPFGAFGLDRERERSRGRGSSFYGVGSSYGSGFGTSFGNMGGDMRPGDWTCPLCMGHNFSSRTECFKCKAAKPGGINKRPGDWWCGKCQAHNFAYRDDCFKCNADKSEGTSEPPVGMNTSRNSARRDGDWDCPKCKAHCFASRTACFKCDEPKPADD